MMTVDVLESRRVTIDLPKETPVGTVVLEVSVAPEVAPAKFEVPMIDTTRLPKYFGAQTGEWPPVGRSDVVREVKP